VVPHCTDDMNNDFTEQLFSYGTLQRESVQLSTFNRTLNGRPDSLIGYRITLIPINNQELVDSSGDTHYRNLEHTGTSSDVIEGTVFAVSESELELADEYEADANFTRVIVELQSGTKAWVYLSTVRRADD
jgi:hypothetical protein